MVLIWNLNLGLDICSRFCTSLYLLYLGFIFAFAWVQLTKYGFYDTWNIEFYGIKRDSKSYEGRH